MKTKNVNKKLTLKKASVANLNVTEMESVKGGMPPISKKTEIKCD
jgi:natural product precursor